MNDPGYYARQIGFGLEEREVESEDGFFLKCVLFTPQPLYSPATLPPIPFLAKVMDVDTKADLLSVSYPLLRGLSLRPLRSSFPDEGFNASSPLLYLPLPPNAQNRSRS